MEVEQFYYDNRIVKKFTLATMLFGLIGMLVGLTVALQFVFPQMTYGIDFLSFGRLRPLHTNAIIFAFVGNGIFTGVYYSLQRLVKARMYSDTLSNIHFWGWQLIIVAAAITLPLGLTSSKEYAELEWPIDIAIAVIWIVFGINMFGTLIKRRTRHIYVAIWFYIATWVTVTMLHVVNNLELPVYFFKSYSLYAGVQDALVQWWYGHNAVAFFLTTPYLGLMYYFIPKVSNRPGFSYRLSIIHFWALIFIYIWAGPHHLLYTALPDWAQSLGTVFSIMLIAPSWGGMLNGLLTLRGAWDKVRESPVLKFMVVAVTAYGMSTFEGPMMSLRNVNAISHYTDWTIAHVHIGGLGWNGFLTFGMIYWLIPQMWKTKIWSMKLANFHFWIGTLGIMFWTLPMYWTGLTQSLMWKEFTPEGYLVYPNFLETVTQLAPMYAMRAFGGLLYLTGFIVMLYNMVKTMGAGVFVPEVAAEAAPLEKHYAKPAGETLHRVIERRPLAMLFWSFIAVAIGGAVEIIPTFLIDSNVPTISAVQPYTPLELEGRDLYIREGCNNCHSQMVRPFRSETVRYGEYSKAGEFVYDHPHLWGSKRTGPDLHREGQGNQNAKSNLWHLNHFYNPEAISDGSIMPPYPWFITDELDVSHTADKIVAMRKLGVPYPEGYEQIALEDLQAQAQMIADDIMNDPQGVEISADREVIAIIAYLQRLGSDIHNADPETLPLK